MLLVELMTFYYLPLLVHTRRCRKCSRTSQSQLPDSREQLSQIVESWGWGTAPITEFLAGLTFLAFFILEEHIHLQFMDDDGSCGNDDCADDDDCEEDHKKQPDDDHHHGHSHDHHEEESGGARGSDRLRHKSTSYGSTNTSSSIDEKTNLISSYADDGHRHDHGHNDDNDDDGHHHHGAAVINRRTSSSSICHHNSTIGNDNGGSNGHSYHHLYIHEPKFLQSLHMTPEHASNSTIIDNDDFTTHTHHHHENHIEQHLHGSILASIILLLALSIHSILEGLAIGITNETNVILTTTVAILAHKCFAAYALGSSMIASEINSYHLYLLIGIFSLCTPFGILLGHAIYIFTVKDESVGSDNDDDGNDDGSSSKSNTSSMLLTGIIQAMVSGTFLYIAIVEVAMKELMNCRQSPSNGDGDNNDHEHHNCDKQRERQRLIAFVVGYVAMSALAIVV